MTRRTRSRRTRLAVAGALAVPLLAVPTAAVAAEIPVRSPLVRTVDSAPWGGWLADSFGSDGTGSYGWSGGYGTYYGSDSYGSNYGGAYGGLSGGYGSDSGSSATSSSGSRANDAESTGVVLIDTTVDYGEGEAAGTGLVIGSDGIVVTNHHVVEGATKITVTDPSDDQEYSATVLGYDSTHDVAVLQLSGASGLSTIATDPTTSEGESVTSVGNAEGGGALIAADGSITRRRTSIDVTEDDGSTAHLANLIEDDADVVSGDSGGALLDSEDEVVGMNVAATSGTSEVRGYAIPIARVLRIATRIEDGTSSSTVTLGAGAALGITLGDTSSLQVAGVVSGGAADEAGVSAGDTITTLNGTDVSTYAELKAVLESLEPGDRVTLAWTDTSGSARSAAVTLDTAPVG